MAQASVFYLQNTEAFFTALKKALPPTFSRKEAAAALKGVYTACALSNLDCKGKGPLKLRIGRVVVYERDSFVAWLRGRTKVYKHINKETNP